MKIGDYVRTIYGIKKITDIVCGQDVRFDNTNGFDEDLERYHNYDGISLNGTTWNEIVIGEPKENIIDLIQVGDYVDGCYIQKIFENKNGIMTCLLDTDYECLSIIKNDEIQSILTKEQFESTEYRIGE